MHESCTTHGDALAEHGIESGDRLVAATHYRLRDREVTDPAPTPSFLGALVRAFEDAYVDAARVPIVPEPLAAAIEDARTVLTHRLLDDADRDLRTDLLPTFYRLVARFYCELRGLTTDGESAGFGD